MRYEDYFSKFNDNDLSSVIPFIDNQKATDFLLENAPRLYCPDQVIEETFAFRTWVMRKHVKKTPAGFLITEFLPDVYWAGKFNTINAPLIHHLNDFRWLKNADDFLDYVKFFLSGDNGAYSYHVPALAEMYEFCILTDNEKFLKDNVSLFENYFKVWVDTHFTENGLFWSIDDREGTEYSISGTTPDMKFGKGLRPLMNACMYGDAIALSKFSTNPKFYLDFASKLKEKIDAKLWDGEFYKAVHPTSEDFSRQIDYCDIPEGCNAKELTSYAPWVYGMPDTDKAFVFDYLKDKNVFNSKMGLSSAERSHPRFMYPVHKPCSWNGKVWPFSTSIAINAIIKAFDDGYKINLDNKDLYSFIQTYAQMHYMIEDGKRYNYIGEVMLPDQHVWHAHEWFKGKDVPITNGGADRGRDYNHSTFIDLVLRGLCGINVKSNTLNVNPRIDGVWDWFKIENLTFKRQTYNVYYDKTGKVFNKGAGVIIEKVN